jgi:D-serine dehydratase
MILHPLVQVAEPPRIKESPMPDYRVARGEANEDQVTAAIEKYTSKVPSSVYLGCAIGSIIGSIAYKAANKTDEALFVGQWVAPFLLLGLYNKMVKQHGSDAQSS